MKNAWKKTLAGLTALVLVAGAMPANVGGFLTKSVGIVAYAESYHSTSVVTGGEIRIADMWGGQVISKNCSIYKNNSYEFIIYDIDGTTELQHYGSGGFIKNVQPGYDVIVVQNGRTVKVKKCSICTVSTAPTAKENLVANRSAQELIDVNSVSATGGTVKYQLGTSANTAPTGEWSTTAPTGTDAGTYYVWYKAIATEDNYADSVPACLTVTIASPYTKHDAVPATCTTAGTAEYWTDKLGNMYSDANGENQITEIQTVPATGHSYNETSPIWTWIKNGDSYDVSVQFKCKNCGDIVVPETQPTKDEVISDGNKTITATVEFEGETYTAIKSFAASYKININGTEKQYNYGEKIKAVAPPTMDGQYFDGWYEGNTKISGSETYYFYAYRDMEIEARYTPAEVEAQPVLSMNVTNREELANGKQKVSFIYDWELPEGCTLEKAAIVRSYEQDTPTISTADTNVHYTKLTNARGTYKLNLTMGAVSAAKNIHVRGYIKYKDSSGTSHELYTTVVTSAPQS